jgi:hypothetical protein
MGTYATHGTYVTHRTHATHVRGIGPIPFRKTSQADERIFRRKGFRLQVGGRSATY